MKGREPVWPMSSSAWLCQGQTPRCSESCPSAHSKSLCSPLGDDQRVQTKWLNVKRGRPGRISGTNLGLCFRGDSLNDALLHNFAETIKNMTSVRPQGLIMWCNMYCHVIIKRCGWSSPEKTQHLRFELLQTQQPANLLMMSMFGFLLLLSCSRLTHI